MVEKQEKPCNVCTDFKTMAKIPKKKCPPDAGELGRSTWTFLHTMAAYYPENPTMGEQLSMNAFIDGLSRFYPCGYCADHLQKEIKENPPKVKSNVELSDWFCQIHNEVNERQGKPKFDCSQVFERWRDGPKGSDCFK
jgi:FAD-linked sulfhydryl oxidase